MKLLALDTETTGVDVFNDRVVTAFIGVYDTETSSWGTNLEFLVNPGVPIPEGASNVHGITDEVASQGMDPVEFLEILFYVLHDHSDLPIVVMNANYDLSLINAELERYGFAPFDWNKRQIIDPLVIDRGKDRYRRGKRNLTRLAEVYQVPVDESLAHDAAYDCYLAVNVAAAQIRRWGVPSNQQQADLFEAWRGNFEEYLRKQAGDDTIVVERGWPVREKEEQ